MEEKKISVVVPVYNAQDHLERCVKGLFAQTYQNLEIILVDDGSKDKSGAICDHLAQRDSRVKVIHKQNGGVPVREIREWRRRPANISSLLTVTICCRPILQYHGKAA